MAKRANFGRVALQTEFEIGEDVLARQMTQIFPQKFFDDFGIAFGSARRGIIDMGIF